LRRVEWRVRKYFYESDKSRSVFEMTEPGDFTEARWFKVVVLVVTAIIIVVCAFNVSTYNKLRNGTNISGLMDSNEALALMISNLIILILAIIIFIWAVFRLFFNREFRSTIGTHTVNFVTTEEGGFNPLDENTITKSTIIKPTITKPTKPKVAVGTAKSVRRATVGRTNEETIYDD
jgi:hypothetical protein